MLKTLALFFILFFWLPCYSQDKHKIDSLLSLVQQSKDDSLKADLYIGISDEYWSDNPAKCKEYANKALAISKKISSHNLMLSAYRNMGSASSFIGKMAEALYYDRLCLSEAVLSGNEKKIMGVCGNLGDDLTLSSKFDSANLVLDLGIKIAKKYNNTEQLCILYTNKGNNLYYQSKFDSCEIYFQDALKKSIALNDSENIVKLYNNIASIRLQRGISDSVVINYLMNAILINEKKKQYLNLGDCYDNLASAYNIRKNHEKAIYYLKKGIRAYTMAENERKTVPLLASMADQFRKMNLKDSATFYADIAIEKGERNQFQHGLAAAYSIKGIVLSDNLNYDSAEFYLQKAFLEFSENKDGEGILLSGNYLANVLAKQEKYKEAKAVAIEVFHLADISKNFQAIKNSSLTLSEIFHKQHDDTRAYEYLNYYITAVDTINNVQNARLLEDMATKYETEKKEKENAKLKLENLSEQNDVIKERNLKLIFLGAIVILSLIISLIVKSNRTKSKASQLAQQSELLKQQNDIKQRISNDLHDDIGSGLTRITMMCRQGESDFKKQIPIDSSLLDKISLQSQELSENLGELIWAANLENDNLSSLFLKIRTYTYSFLESSTIQPKINLSDDVPSFPTSPETNRNIYLILKEGLNNVVKHSEAEKVEIDFFVDNNKYFKLEIRDNGKGFDVNTPTDRNGRKSLEERVAAINEGKLELKSEIGQGTTLTVVGKLS